MWKVWLIKARWFFFEITGNIVQEVSYIIMYGNSKDLNIY